MQRLAIAAIAAATVAQAQDWTRQSPYPYPPETQPHVDFFGDRGYLVGENNALLETVDGGVTWQRRSMGGADFNNLFCLDDRHGWLVGDGAVALWRTTDAGETWQQMNDLPGGSYFHVEFITPDDGWTTGNGPHTAFTHDGGVTWTLAETDTGAFVVGGNLGSPPLALGKSPQGIVRSTDGGENWSLVYPTTGDLAVARFLSETDAVATIGGQVLHSGDGGASWSPVSSGVMFPAVPARFSETHALLWTRYQAEARYTTDGGRTWNPVTLPTGPFEIVVIDEDTAFALDQGGVIYGTDDAGATWTLRNDKPGLLLWDAAFSTPDIGYATGNQNIMYRTADGGKTWDYLSQGVDTTFYDIEMWDARRGLAVGGNVFGIIARTDDGGQTWLPGFEGGALDGVSVLAPEFAVIVGDFNTISRTTDGGRTWTDISDGVPLGVGANLAVDFVTQQEGWVSGGISGYIIHTSDGGESWEMQKGLLGRIALGALEMYDSELGLCGGSASVLFRTDNGGATWEDIAVPTPFSSIDVLDVGFASREVAWLVGEFGFIARSEDGGRSWTEQDSGTDEQLFGLHIVSETEAWVVGGYGTMLHTTDAGESWTPVSIGVPGIAGGLLSLLEIVGTGGSLWTVGDRGTIIHAGSSCVADCDGDGELTFFDFLCYQNLFAAGDPAADCDGDGGLDFFDFLCFQNAFAAGCP